MTDTEPSQSAPENPENPENPDQIVVVGGGLAGAAAVTELRERGYEGAITLVAGEPHLPYERPPLSKDLLLGKGEDDEDVSLFVHDQAWYDEHRVDVRTGTRATALDTATRTLSTDAGELSYDRLLLATGSAPRPLPMAEGIDPLYLRTLDDSRALQQTLTGRLLVVGGGWIGLEVAAAAREAGGEVTLVESQDLPLQGVLGERMAGIFADLHREHGVDLRLGARLESLTRGPDGVTARLGDGSEVVVDTVVVGIGAAPDLALAESAGLAVDDGVLVDGRLRTSDPHVWAAGDIALHDHPVLGRRVRVEHWDTAQEQGKAAAAAMLGDETAYSRLPYFFSDQYDLGMEYVGHVDAAGPEGFDRVVVRGDEAGRVCVAFYVRGDLVVAGMQVNDWDASDALWATVGRRIDPDRLADESVPLDQL